MHNYSRYYLDKINLRLYNMSKVSKGAVWISVRRLFLKYSVYQNYILRIQNKDFTYTNKARIIKRV